MLFHCNDACTNVLQCYVLLTLSVLFTFPLVEVSSQLHYSANLSPLKVHLVHFGQEPVACVGPRACLDWTLWSSQTSEISFDLQGKEFRSPSPAMTELLCPLHHCLSIDVIKEFSCTKYSTCKIFTNKRYSVLHYTRRIKQQCIYREPDSGSAGT